MNADSHKIWGEFRSVLHSNEPNIESLLIDLVLKWSESLYSMPGLRDYILERYPLWNPVVSEIPPTALSTCWLRDERLVPLNFILDGALCNEDIICLYELVDTLDFFVDYYEGGYGEVEFENASSALIDSAWSWFSGNAHFAEPDRVLWCSKLGKFINAVDVDSWSQAKEAGVKDDLFYFVDIEIHANFPKLPLLGLYINGIDSFDIVWYGGSEWTVQSLILLFEVLWQIGVSGPPWPILCSHGEPQEYDNFAQFYKKYVSMRQIWALVHERGVWETSTV